MPVNPRKSLSMDAVAGLSVAIVALPLALGFGITSGASPSAGLTTAIIAGFIAAFFGGSRFQVSGPTGAMTVVLIPIIAKFGIHIVPMVGLMAGVIVIVLSLLRAGHIINRVPWPVVEGFTVGIALVIALQQLPLVFGIKKGAGDRSIPVALSTIRDALHAGLSPQSIFIVFVTLFVKFTFPILWKKLKITFHIPASIIAILVSLLLVKILNFDIAAIGDIPRSIGTWDGAALSVDHFSELIIPALMIAALCAIESLLSARVADGMAHVAKEDRYQPNRELFGQGLGTIFASLFGGLPATGAIARSSVNVRSGAHSKYAAIFHSLFLLVIALFAGALVSQIPTAAIAGVLLGTSYRILNPASIRESLQTTKKDASVLITTAAATLFIDLIWGIIIGIGLHLIFVVNSKRIGSAATQDE